MVAMPLPRAVGDSPMPVRAGIGLKPAHYADILTGSGTQPAWVEAHPENYMCAGGPPLRDLEAIRRDLPLSFHGVSLSLGSADGMNTEWLGWMKRLIARFEPALVSEHLSWSTAEGAYLNDLLPLPYTEESLAMVASRLGAIQDELARQVLIENPSTYLRYRHSPIPEPAFLAELVRRTGCGLLVDVNNLYVNARNHGFDPVSWLGAIPAQAVGEFHLAGHTAKTVDDTCLLIDDHASPVSDPVWDLYDAALSLTGPRPTLIEWDCEIPPFEILAAEARIADSRLVKRVAS